jgi:phenylalanyl-tRNA synthetase beta chain
MIELGQPLHAFDGENIKKIIVRKANKGEKITTLDDKERILDEEDLLICSDKEILAIAGVLGGKNSQINNASTSIIIESANFDAISVRKTAQRLGIRSDAVMRFEKSLDPNWCEMAIKKAAELVKKVCPQAKFNYELIEAGDFKNQEQIINLDILWAEKIIGQKIEDKKIENILSSLGLEIKDKNDNIWQIAIPSWRQKDLKIKQDLIEEITFALIAELSEVDGQKIVYEDLLEFDLEDVLALQAEISGKFKSLTPTASSTSPKQQAGNTAK